MRVSRAVRLSRRHAAGDERHRYGAVLEDVRAAGAGFRTCSRLHPYRFLGARPGETIGEAAARELEEAIPGKARRRLRPSSLNLFTGPAACSIRRMTTGLACGKCALATTCC